MGLHRPDEAPPEREHGYGFSLTAPLFFLPPKAFDIKTYDEVKSLNDHQLLQLLREAWGYGPKDRLAVVGRLTKIRLAPRDGTEHAIYVIEDIRNAKDFTPVSYPVESEHGDSILQSVFVPPRYVRGTEEDVAKGPMCIANVTFSPREEREKRNNPFALQVSSGVQLLSALPADQLSVAKIDDVNYVEQVLVDHWKRENRVDIENSKKRDLEFLEAEHREKANAIRETTIELRQELDDLQSGADQKSSEFQHLSDEVTRIEARVKAANEMLLDKDRQLEASTREYEEFKRKMESNRAKLTRFVKEKMDDLRRLELVSESDLAHLTGFDDNDEPTSESFDFEADLDENYAEAARYLQSYLRGKDVYYMRDILENFMALLRTNDLVILAGDSGSGKTNLVTSVADAIGGRAIVIPVKPNWTSSEDLLGYYNPLEKKYISTPFLDALIEASRHPDVPFLLCLDEMNLARVEYYFADFLSLLEDRNSLPELYLYSDAEAAHTLSEFNIFMRLIGELSTDLDRDQLGGYIELLKDEELSRKISAACGFEQSDSLLRYHSELRRILSTFINTPSSLRVPDNVRIVGTINVDETTHYLSSKILDRAHVVRFRNPLSLDWDAYELETADLDYARVPLRLTARHLGERTPYPRFNLDDERVAFIVDISRDYLRPMGVDIGLRTVRQALHYFKELELFGIAGNVALDYFLRQKVLPKMMFDGARKSGDAEKKDHLMDFQAFIKNRLREEGEPAGSLKVLDELDNLITRAQENDWIVNYWNQ